MRKQDTMESSSNLVNAPPMWAITTRMMQTPLVRSTKSMRLLLLSSIVVFVSFYGRKDTGYLDNNNASPGLI